MGGRDGRKVGRKGWSEWREEWSEKGRDGRRELLGI